MMILLVLAIALFVLFMLSVFGEFPP